MESYSPNQAFSALTYGKLIPKEKMCHIPTREVNISANKIPQTVDVGTEHKKRILSLFNSQSQDFANKHKLCC